MHFCFFYTKVTQVENTATIRTRNGDTVIAKGVLRGITSNAESLDSWVHAIVPDSEKDQRALKARMAAVTVTESLWARPITASVTNSINRPESIMTADEAFATISRIMS